MLSRLQFFQRHFISGRYQKGSLVSRQLFFRHIQSILLVFRILLIKKDLVVAKRYLSVSRKELKKSGAIIWPVLAAVAVGFSDTISKTVINKTSAFDFLLALAVVQLPIALIYLKLEKQSYMLTMKNVIAAPYDYFHSLVGGLFTVAGTGLLWVSFNYTLASVAAPIIATSGALIVLFATLFLDERMKQIDLRKVTMSKVIQYNDIDGVKQITMNSLKTKGEFRIYEKVYASLSTIFTNEEAMDIRKRFVRQNIKIKELTNAAYQDVDTSVISGFNALVEIRYIDPKIINYETEFDQLWRKASRPVIGKRGRSSLI